MTILRLISFIALITICSINTDAQISVPQISEIEKSVFTISSYDNDKNEISTNCGFFINNKGVAVAPASIFRNATQVIITLRNGREYEVEKIVSVHKVANLAMFKVVDIRSRAYNYIESTEETEGESDEVLILGHPTEMEKGMDIANVNSAQQIVYINRTASLKSNFTSKSMGAPVINQYGKLVGISYYQSKNKTHHFIGSQILKDSLWIDYSSVVDWKNISLEKKRKELYHNMFEGLLNFSNSNWIEAAKCFTKQIEIDSSDVVAYVLRSEARRLYNNNKGAMQDFNMAKKLNPNHYLLHYYSAKENIRKKNNDKAIDDLLLSIDINSNFSPALVELGLLVENHNRDIETALKCYNKAIMLSPIYAVPYIERARIKIQHLNAYESAIVDIEKAIELNCRLEGAYAIKAAILMHQKDYIVAIDILNKAIKIDSTDRYSYFNRGLAYYNLGLKAQSCNDWREANNLGHVRASQYLSQFCNSK